MSRDTQERIDIVAITRIWKVYGADGHRQRESFGPSKKYNFSSEKDGVRILEVFNSDKTNTNEFSIIKITRNVAEECEKELYGQISDGIFENSRVGEIKEIAQLDLVAMLGEREINIIYFDTETTGLNENGDDEILSISIIDNDDNVILDTLVKPTHHTSWEGAQRVHGISPEMVADAPTLEQLMPVINKAFAECDMYCAYNTDYDLEFIAPHLSSTAKERLYHKKLDCMKEFAPIFGEWNAARGDYKWQELVVAAAYYNVEWTGSAHGSLADTRATREVYLNIHPELRPAEKKVKTEVKKNTQSRGR